MILKSLVIGLLISTVMFLISVISNILGFLFLEEIVICIGPIITLIQIFVLFGLAYLSGFYYSVFFKEYISEAIKNISAAIIYVTQVVLVLPVAYIVFEINPYGAFIFFIFIVLFYGLLFFFFTKWCLKKGSISAVKKVAPELIIDKEDKVQPEVSAKDDFNNVFISIAVGLGLFLVVSFIHLLNIVIITLFLSNLPEIGGFLVIIPVIVIMFISNKIGYYYSSITKKLIPSYFVFISTFIFVLLFIFSYLVFVFIMKIINPSTILGIIINTLFFFFIYYITASFKLTEGSIVYAKENIPELLDDEELDGATKIVKEHIEKKDNITSNSSLQQAAEPVKSKEIRDKEE